MALNMYSIWLAFEQLSLGPDVHANDDYSTDYMLTGAEHGDLPALMI